MTVGDTLDDLYLVEAVLGEGSFGQVLRVRHSGWDLPLAVKLLRPELAQEGDHVALFLRECEGWVNLGRHPHIGCCHYVFWRALQARAGPLTPFATLHEPT